MYFFIVISTTKNIFMTFDIKLFYVILSLTLFLVGGSSDAPYCKLYINHFERYFLDLKCNNFLIIGVTDPMKPIFANIFH